MAKPSGTSLMPYPDLEERLTRVRDTTQDQLLRELVHDALDTIQRLAKAYEAMQAVLARRERKW